VWARQSGTAYKYNAYAINSLLIGVHYCMGASLGADTASPAAAGTGITVMAIPIDCETAAYKFFEMFPGTSNWVMVEDWFAGSGAQGVYGWDTTGIPPGLYRWAVWVRDAGSTRTYDSYGMLSFWIT
jgi:hypothetical protein